MTSAAYQVPTTTSQTMRAVNGTKRDHSRREVGQRRRFMADRQLAEQHEEHGRDERPDQQISRVQAASR